MDSDHHAGCLVLGGGTIKFGIDMERKVSGGIKEHFQIDSEAFLRYLQLYLSR